MSKNTLWKLYGVIVTSIVALMFVVAAFAAHVTIAGSLALSAVVIGIWGLIVALVLE